MSIQSAIVGKWNFESSENFDAYMKEAGVGMMTRTVAAKLKPTLEFVVEGDNWTMTSVSTFKTHASKFTIGLEQDDKTADGRDVKSLYTLVNDHLIQVEKSNSGGKDSRIDRYIDGGKLVIVSLRVQRREVDTRLHQGLDVLPVRCTRLEHGPPAVCPTPSAGNFAPLPSELSFYPTFNKLQPNFPNPNDNL
ncbi:hypothetical protein WR25_23779 [Diploscapter pachys]|uniref:Cytosolic fatty-acid binding proteins domain-containing protein n=1 Tax=Diploscapter pachys TaxID=2018661 RepID=A0A2A2JMH5_9BILA|nr:hypothetical protein WR25_23779 [Diploscapter pachys]